MNITIKNKIVSNDGTELGKIEGDTCSLLQPVGPAIKAGISKAHGSKLKFALVEAPSGLEGEDGPVGSAGMPGIPGPSDAPQGVEGVPGHHEPDERDEPVHAHTVGKPERNPLLGDKCPKLIAWKSAQKGGK